MDKFDLQIAMLKPTTHVATLNERQFMKKLTQAHRARLIRRALMALMGLAALAIVAGALRRDILGVLTLTFRYFGDLPSMLTEYSQAYAATISWPGVVSLLFVAALGVLLVRSRKDLTATHSRRTYRYAAVVAVLALTLGITGLVGSSTHAHAHQETLKRILNERGHLEVQVGGKDYELYAKSNASDESIRNQATIEEIRNFDIAKAYPELQNMNRYGFVAEVRAVNTKDDCIFYVERRLEPALNKILDANSGCIRSSDPVQYLSPQLQATKAPKWKVGQTVYLTSARTKDTSVSSFGGYVGIVVLLDGKADHYVARSNSEQIVPKGQPSTGVQSCGINRQDDCPKAGYIDLFTNAEGKMASGEIGSSVPGDSLQPKSGSEMIELFGKITVVDDHQLQVVTDSGRKITTAWPRNIIEEFNTHGALNYQMTTGTLHVQPGDHLFVRIGYKDGMDLEKLSLSDVYFIGVATKTSLPDPLTNETYSKEKATQLEKY